MTLHPVLLLGLFDFSGGEMMLIFFVVLLFFGGEKLPQVARGLGRSIREFKKASAGVEEEIKRAMAEPPPPPRVINPPPALVHPEPAPLAALAAPMPVSEIAPLGDSKPAAEAAPPDTPARPDSHHSDA